MFKIDGSLSTVQATGTVRLFPNCDVRSVLGTFQDITEQLENERLLAERTQSLLQAKKLAHIGHWMACPKTGELYRSDEVYLIHGQEIGSISNVEAAINAYHPDDRDQVTEYVRLALEEKQNSQLYLRIQWPNNEIQHIRTTRIINLDNNDNVDSLLEHSKISHIGKHL